MADKKKVPAPPADELASFGITVPAMPTIGAGNARQPLGPPQGFYAEQTAFQTEAGTLDPEFQAKGAYVTGDEWVPAFNLTKEERDALKARMNAAGLYGTSGFASGDWTQADANAYQIVLESANGMGIRNADVVIDNLANDARRSPRVQGPRAPLVSQISNPDDIRAVIRKSAYELTGSRLSDDDEQRLISMYQGQQGSVNAAVHAGGSAAPGLSTAVTNEAGMQNFANAQIERMRPGEVQNVRAMNFMDKMLESIGTTQIQGPASYSGEGLPKTGQVGVL